MELGSSSRGLWDQVHPHLTGVTGWCCVSRDGCVCHDVAS